MKSNPKTTLTLTPTFFQSFPMDLTTPTTTKTPNSENGTNSQKGKPNKSLTFTNGAPKKHHHHHSGHLTPGPPPPPAVAVVTHKQCLKNHAASMGGHAVDGCIEFMPSPAATAGDPTSLKCAACGCHRNFHRRELPKPTVPATHFIDFRNPRHHPPPSSPHGGAATSSASPSPSPPPPPSHYSSVPHMLLALSSARPNDPPPQTHHHQRPSPLPHPPHTAAHPSGRKRFRSKFSREQKEKMLSFSEKLGWKMQKCDESMISDFCNEIGIRKNVLKVWMHNNKHTYAKRATTTTINGQNTTTTYHIESSGVQLNVSTDGSSSLS